MLVTALVLTALTMGLEFAHVLEWPQKQHCPGRLYVRLQESLYLWFGNLGGVLYVLLVITVVRQSDVTAGRRVGSGVR